MKYLIRARYVYYRQWIETRVFILPAALLVMTINGFSYMTCPFNGVIESLDDIYSQNSTGWLFVVHAKATEFIYLS